MIAQKTWREVRVMALVYLAILVVLMVPVILLWPEIQGDLQKATFFKSLASFDFLKRIGEGITDRDVDVAYLNWMALQLFFKGVNLAGLAAAVLLGTALFAREREAQTLEFLLARPVGRGRILFAKSWPVVLCVTAPVFLANWAAIPLSHGIDQPLPFGPVTLCCVHSALFVLCFLAFTTWVSVLCRVQAHVAFWIGGATILNIGVYLVPRLRRFSCFRLSDFDIYSPLLLGTRGPADMFDPLGHGGQTTWLLLAIAVGYGLAWRALERLEP